jgi:hypothetical protein
MNPAAELKIAVGGGQAPPRGVKNVGQRYLVAYTRLSAPGCYAWQIDGTTFSRVVVFSVPVDPWTALRRPLRLPTVAPGGACPVNGLDTSFDFARYGVASGIGPGPVWPIGLGQPGSVLRFQYPPPANTQFAGSEWGGNKVLWFVSPTVTGPVLVRGGRLDAAGEVRFGPDRVPSTELRLTSTLDHPSTSRVRASGCYAYQVDGLSFSYPIAFRAEVSN